MKKSIAVLLTVLLVAVFALSGCTNTNDPSADPSADPSVETPASSISEDEALAVVLEDLSIAETAAEDLTITESEVDGKAVYVIAFMWSGFDYQYTIDAATGEIVETIFDGSVL